MVVCGGTEMQCNTRGTTLATCSVVHAAATPPAPHGSVRGCSLTLLSPLGSVVVLSVSTLLVIEQQRNEIEEIEKGEGSE